MGKLTAQEVKNAKLGTGKKIEKKPDGQGLFLLINKSGKYWRYQYRFVGKQKTLAIVETALYIPAKIRAVNLDKIIGSDPAKIRIAGHWLFFSFKS